MFLNAAELMRISLLQHLTETPFGWTFYLWTTKNRRQGNFGTFSNPFFWGWRRWTCQKYSIWISIWVLVPNPKVFKKFSFITCCFFWMVQLILGKFSIHTRCSKPLADLAELKRPVESPSHGCHGNKPPVSLDSSADKTKEMDMKNSMYLKVIQTRITTVLTPKKTGTVCIGWFFFRTALK